MIGKVNGKYFDIVLTDIKLHTSKANSCDSFSRKIEKSIKNGKSQRVYKEINNSEEGILNFSIDLPEKAKDKIIRIFTPKEGIPIKIGKDAEEKIISMKKRGLLKNL